MYSNKFSGSPSEGATSSPRRSNLYQRAVEAGLTEGFLMSTYQITILRTQDSFFPLEQSGCRVVKLNYDSDGACSNSGRPMLNIRHVGQFSPKPRTSCFSESDTSVNNFVSPPISATQTPPMSAAGKHPPNPPPIGGAPFKYALSANLKVKLRQSNSGLRSNSVSKQDHSKSTSNVIQDK